jgi:hypothetical protein
MRTVNPKARSSSGLPPAGAVVVRFAVLGFPRCGTTALAHALNDLDGLNVVHAGNRWEVDLTQRPLPPEECFDPRSINGHKFATYIYNRRKLGRLLKLNPDMQFIVCVRDPRRSLVSWFRMHRDIAQGAWKSKTHFAWREREFYRSCSIAQYYEHFAQPRLRYCHHLTAALEVLPTDQVVVVAQPYMAAAMRSTLATLCTRLGSSAVPAHEARDHVSRSEKDPVDLPREINETLAKEYAALQSLVRQEDLAALI